MRIVTSLILRAMIGDGEGKMCHSWSVSGGEMGYETYRLLWSSEEFRSLIRLPVDLGNTTDPTQLDCAEMIAVIVSGVWVRWRIICEG